MITREKFYSYIQIFGGIARLRGDCKDEGITCRPSGASGADQLVYAVEKAINS
ncbi:MAG: hypothetical protein H6Q74_2224 [Firmicutes bacterium]|nr:hypothetical protein [Bacillota bacterium]